MIVQNQALALFLVRVVIGTTFIMHGLQKVFGLFEGPGLAGFASWLVTLHIPAWLAYAAALAELIGGIMVLLGIATELGALVIAINMVVGIYLVHMGKGYFSQTGGFEYPLNILLLCVALIVGGPGIYYLWKIKQ